MPKSAAKILILDIETAPTLAYTWGAWNQNIHPEQIESDWFVLTWAAKWIFENKVYSGKLTSKEALQEDDKRIMQSMWKLLDEADIVIAHNADKFDIPRINTRFLVHGIKPPMAYLVIDTLKHIRKQFSFTHNKLDYVNKLLGLPRKKENSGMPMWVACRKGDTKALKEMHDYNVEDVRILEETYLKIRAWIKPHPNLGLHICDTELSRCPTCGSDKIEEHDKLYHTTAGVYKAFRCGECGSTGRMRKNELTIKQKRPLLLSLPR